MRIAQRPCGDGLRIRHVITPILPVGDVRVNQGNKIGRTKALQKEVNLKTNLQNAKLQEQKAYLLVLVIVAAFLN